MRLSASRLPTRRDLEDLEYYKCATDWRYWITHHGWIRDEGSGRIYGPGLRLWPGQWEFTETYAEGLDLIALKARQLGFSWLATNIDCWDIMFHDNVDLGCVAQNDEGSMFHRERLGWIYSQQAPHLARALPVIGKQNKHVLGLSNGSSFTAAPSTGNIRGQAWKRTRLEEFAFMAKASEVWTAVTGQTGVGKRQIAVISTAEGEGGAYHNLWLQAETGQNGLKPVFLGWRGNPEHDDDWYAEQARKLGAKVKQEHPETPEDAFLGAGVKFFDVRELARLQGRFGASPLRVILADMPPEQLSGTELAGLHCGLRIYAEPMAGRRYTIGADTADAGTDGCSCDVIDDDTGEQVAKYLSYTDRAGEFGDSLQYIGRLYNNALIAVERNGTGYGTLESLRAGKYPAVYRAEDGEPGWLTSNVTRIPMLDGLRVAWAEGELIVHDFETYRQARIFGWHKRKWQHPDDDHDDSVFSLGIAQAVREGKAKRRGQGEPIRVHGAHSVRVRK